MISSSAGRVRCCTVPRTDDLLVKESPMYAVASLMAILLTAQDQALGNLGFLAMGSDIHGPMSSGEHITTSSPIQSGLYKQDR